jgi:Xaa-Pro aminopeptidase
MRENGRMVSPDVARRRRQRVLNRLGDGLLLLPTARLRLRNGDVYHGFRPDSDFYYLTGLAEPEAVLAAHRIDSRRHRAIIFVRPRDPERELWDGPRLGPTRAKRRLGFDEAYPIEKLYEVVEEQLKTRQSLFYTLGQDPVMDQSLSRVFERLQAYAHRRNPSAHPTIRDPGPVIASARIVKDRSELRTLQLAAEVACAGHRRAMEIARSGMMEYELEAEIEATFRRLGSERNGYESIVASGANACILHYVTNNRRMRPNDLVLVDAGAEVSMYTADITRTFPVSGRFTEPQADVYRIVLRAQKAAIRAVKAGRSWKAPHTAAVRAIVDGLLGIGLLRGSRERLIEREAYRRWFMHGTSHWLGMDVHDAGGYEDETGRPKKLVPGMVLTIEPGLYFSPRDGSVPRKYRGIGVRIEDDVVVTRSGCRVLTEGAPKEIKAVEAICQRLN